MRVRVQVRAGLGAGEVTWWGEAASKVGGWWSRDGASAGATRRRLRGNAARRCLRRRRHFARRRPKGRSRPSSARLPWTRRSPRWTSCSTSWLAPSTCKGEHGPLSHLSPPAAPGRGLTCCAHRRRNFALSFAARDAQGRESFMPLLSDGDLAAAFTTARPALRLRLDVRPAADCEQLGVGEGSWRAPRLALTVPPPSPCRPAAGGLGHHQPPGGGGR